MTINEAREMLKKRNKELIEYAGNREQVNDALDIAIASLEAWGKFRNEVGACDDEFTFVAVQTVKEMIDAHLQEIEK